MSAPPLETERLTLRAHTRADHDDSFSLWSNANVVRHIGGQTSTREEVWGRILRYAGLWSLLGYGYWIVREKATGAFVGEVGFADFDRDLVPSIRGVPEAGWVLAPSAHGKGYATEAAASAHAWVAAHLHARRTVCLIDEANVASIRVAHKLGYTEWARSRYKAASVVIFERRV